MSERYNYLEQVTADAKEAILYNMSEWEFDNREELEKIANGELWVEDSVTGNASGSYFCNAWKAEEALCHNLDLLGEAVEEFGDSMDMVKRGAEVCDVTIRCYLLSQAINIAINELEGEDKLNYSAE